MAEILVIDDEAPIRETLKEILEYENYTVTTADDGNKGLLLIQKNEYDVVLCDVKMPGIDGMELLDQVSQQKSFQDFRYHRRNSRHRKDQRNDWKSSPYRSSRPYYRRKWNG